MKKKPIPLILLAVLHFATPLFSLLFNALLLDIPILKYVPLFWQSHNAMELIEFFTFHPIAGLLILSLTPVGYVAYLPLTAWTIFTNTYIWSLQYSTSGGTLVLANAFNVLCFAYMMAPSVRRSFLDTSLHWWKSAPRFSTDISKANINSDPKSEVTIQNISSGGALVKTLWQPNIGENLDLNFTLGEHNIFTKAEVVHKNEDTFGVKFLAKDKSLSKALKTTPLKPLEKPTSPIEDLNLWIGQVKKGQGIFPQLPHS